MALGNTASNLLEGWGYLIGIHISCTIAASPSRVDANSLFYTSVYTGEREMRIVIAIRTSGGGGWMVQNVCKAFYHMTTMWECASGARETHGTVRGDQIYENIK